MGPNGTTPAVPAGPSSASPAMLHGMADVRITVRPNGPYLVKGPIELVDGDDNAFLVENETIALCRCGHSTNKPFCDGTHKTVGFDAATTAVSPPNSDTQ